MNRKPKLTANKFIDDRDYENLIGYGQEYLKSHINSYFLLFKPDLSKTEVNIYGEIENDIIDYDGPYRIDAFIEVGESTNETYLKNTSSVRYEEYGNLIASFFLSDLDVHGITVEYGDIVAYQINTDIWLYYEVADDSKKNFSDDSTFMQISPYWTEITCTPISHQKRYEEILGI